MTELAALAVQPSTFDPMKALLVASQLRQADAQNTLANLTIQDRQDAKNGLAEYSRMDAAGDPGGAMRALTKASPQMAMHIMQLKKSGLDLDNEQTQQILVKNGRDAQAVALMPDGPEKDAAWQDRLKTAAQEKRISPEQYTSLSQQKPNSLMLNRIVMNGLSLEQYMQQTNRLEDRTTAKENAAALTRAFDPNSNRTVPQATSGAISPLAYDPSQGLPADSFNTPLSPTPRVSPQQVAQAKTQPQLDPNSGMVTPAVPPVPYVTPVGPDGDYALPSAGPIGGAAPAAAGAQPPASAAAPAPALPPTAQNIIAQAGKQGAAEAPIGSYPEGAPSLGGVPFKRLLPVLLNGSMSDHKPTAETYKEVLKSVLKEAEMTGDQKEYWTSMQQYGETNQKRAAQGLKPLDPPSFDIWKRENLSARSAKGETEFNKHLLGAVGKDWAELYKDGMEARKERAMYGRLGNLLEESGTGTNVAFTNWVREWTGVKLGPKAGLAEAANAIINYAQPKMRVAGSGSTSDADLRAFGRALPSLMSTTDGRRTIVETLGGMTQYRIGASDVVGEYIASGAPDARKGETMQKLSDYATTTDPFAKFKEWQSAQGGKAGVNAPASKGPEVGAVDGGFKFKGGNPADAASWEKVQ